MLCYERNMADRQFPLNLALDHAPAIALIAASRSDWAMHAASACVAAGFRLLAVSAATPQYDDIISALAANPALTVGGARLLKQRQIEACKDAGAEFIMTMGAPACSAIDSFRDRESWIAQALTPLEIKTAFDHGANAVEVFPAAVTGGALYMRHLLDIFPGRSLIASGGVAGDRLGDYLEGGCRAVVLSEAILSEQLMASGDRVAIRNHAAVAHRELTRYAQSREVSG